jgi:5-methylcytosine-specific restriction endonuclease McrA
MVLSPTIIPGKKAAKRKANVRYYKKNKKKELRRNKEWMQNNVERRAEYNRRYSQEHKFRILLQKNALRSSEVLSRHPLLEVEWLFILDFWEWRCPYCGREITKDTVHIEHLIPMSRGGLHVMGNVLGSCPTCNLSKGARTLGEWLDSSAPKKPLWTKGMVELFSIRLADMMDKYYEKVVSEQWGTIIL